MSPSAKRRTQILEVLGESEEPISATTLAKRFSVSRQIIVGDIALLRAAAHEISATPRGYVLQKSRPAWYFSARAARFLFTPRPG